jgi:hypothetical protein
MVPSTTVYVPGDKVPGSKRDRVVAGAVCLSVQVLNLSEMVMLYTFVPDGRAMALFGVSVF